MMLEVVRQISEGAACSLGSTDEGVGQVGDSQLPKLAGFGRKRSRIYKALAHQAGQKSGLMR